ncbi:DUF5709 domain-containing protein [Streptomonospora nanhaiensis]|uniref:DUF5709 domain-containing protein n=1 Tax=Streptomonospora nanhaiensis TaxID=1323731 RepID=A0A853BU74_9ACTN|nr:DUF5709 domain-containing protein [Streptomonospora nanhaiensis]MBV2363629.1 hypothetical protein [Streptomonospora nanhaiensis]NYI98673.1 hypothetical protein [Streptomonospora nanhaiensis]
MTENHPEEHPADPINEDAADWEEAGLPAQEDSTEDLILPAEEPVAMDEVGSTGTEKEAGEPLDEALARDEPDVPGALGSTAQPADQLPNRGPEEDPEGVRLVESDEGVREDSEDTMVAREAGVDRAAYSAEEAAVREEEESDLP